MYKTKLFEEGEDMKTSNNVLEIRNGKYIRGQLDKAVLGSGTNGLIHRTCNDFNNMTSAKFIDDAVARILRKKFELGLFDNSFAVSGSTVGAGVIIFLSSNNLKPLCGIL